MRIPEDLERPARRPGLSSLTSLVEAIGQGLLRLLSDVGGVTTLGFFVARWVFRRPYRVQNFFAQLDFVGVGSTFIVALTGTFSGMVFAYQTAGAFRIFNAESLVGPTVAIAITRELSPVFSSLMVTMRAVSAMCTELGTMRVTEQIDALETMAVSPIHYLLVPRVVAGLLMVPVLVMVFDTAGMLGAYFIAVSVQGLSAGTFINRIQQYLASSDFSEGLIKGAVFGLTVTLIGCYKGYNASGGAKGVGQATTQAMVASAVSIFILDYIVGVILH